MPALGKLVAWIEMTDDGKAIGAFVGETRANKRLPATKICDSQEEAHAWVNREAYELGLHVEWLTPPV
jgi:hypothetical protein